MPFPQTLLAKLTVCHKGKPLVCFSNLPGPDPELTQSQIRQLAAALLRIADDADALRFSVRHYRAANREYALGADMHEFNAAGFRFDAPIWGEGGFASPSLHPAHRQSTLSPVRNGQDPDACDGHPRIAADRDKGGNRPDFPSARGQR